MKRIIGLVVLSLFLFGCCPFTGAIQMAIEGIQNALPGIIGTGPVAVQEDVQIDKIDPTPPEDPEPFVGTINPCEGIYEKYPHDPTLGEIREAYIGSWHAGAFVSDAFNERFVLFSSGNYLFFPDQYECAYSSKTCVPSPIENGLWGVQGQVMHFAKEGELNNIISRSITEVVASPEDESPYPFKTTIDGLTFWLMSKDTNFWDPETGEYCDW